MKKLLDVAFKNPIYRFLMVLTLFSMILLTIATDLEIFAVGVITRRGPEAFELFAPMEGGKLENGGVLTKEQVIKRFDELSKDGVITEGQAKRFLAERKKKDIIEKLLGAVNRVFPVSENLKGLAIFMIVVALFKACMLFFHRYLTRTIVIRVSRDLRQNYFEHIQSLPMPFYQKYNMGSLSSRVVGDSFLIAEAINACLTNYLQTPFAVISSLILCFMTSWQLSLIIFLGLPVVIFPIAYLAKHVKRIAKQLQQNQEQFASVLLDYLAGIMTVKVFAMEEFSLKKYREQNENMAHLEQKSARYDLSSRPVVHTIGMVFLAIALLYGLYVLELNVPTVLFYCGILYVFYEPIKKFAEENNRIQQGVAAADRCFEVMNIKPQIQDAKDAIEMPEFSTRVSFDNVWFSYEDVPVLKGVSFEIKKGETLAIVGPTGSGKSTIVQLLPRLYEVQKGGISIDNKPLSAYTQKSIREQIAFVPQKPFLFLDTVAENIAFGRPFSREEVIEAAKKAHAHEFIEKLPKGYDTLLSETGKNLSGGQQQRLAIARALVKRAPILVMDEATSSLDTLSENRVKLALDELRQEGMTQVIIAHRLTTIEHADRIVYLENGQKLGEGTKDELLATCKGFSLMWKMMQSSAGIRVHAES